YLLTIAWFSVIALAWTVWKRRPTLPTLRARILWAALAILIFAYPVWNQVWRVDARVFPVSDDHKVLDGARGYQYAQLSVRYYSLARYQNALVAARTGVAFAPNLAEAWTRLAQACIPLQRWDEAMNAAERAVQLSPNDEGANEALAALSHRQ